MIGNEQATSAYKAVAPARGGDFFLEQRFITDAVFPSVGYDYILLQLVNEETILAYVRVEYS